MYLYATGAIVTLVLLVVIETLRRERNDHRADAKAEKLRADNLAAIAKHYEASKAAQLALYQQQDERRAKELEAYHNNPSARGTEL
jgi:hypothetical protein